MTNVITRLSGQFHPVPAFGESFGLRVFPNLVLKRDYGDFSASLKRVTAAWARAASFPLGSSAR